MLRTFKIGGVHPPENKLSSKETIKVLAVPEQVIIPLSQHIGAPANPIVAKGDTVKTGQLIASVNGFVSANIHSSVNGTVVSIGEIKDASGLTKLAITIKTEGDEQDSSILKEADNNIDNLSAKDIIQLISNAGIVGMGGATFPAHVKLSPPPGMKAEILIINGVECEPYLTADHRLMLEKPNEILKGVSFIMKAIGVKKAVIGIENNKTDAIELLQNLSAKISAGIEICPLKVRYPQGGEKQLIKAITGKSVPSGALPISVGAVVHNVGTAYAIYEAVSIHKPLYERVVTITGKSVKNPGNYLCRIGTPISKLIDAAGGLPEDTAKVIGGGPMMGRAMVSIDSPIMKGTSGVLLINEKEASRRKVYNCIRCAKCVSACPMGLEPYLLSRMSELNIWGSLEAENVMDCIECGCCSYTCPSNRPLLDYIRLGKAKTGAIIRNRKK